MTYGNYPDLSNVKKILVIKMRHHGDVLLTAPVFSNLKRAAPHAQIDAFLYADTVPMLEGHPDISEFILYDRSWKKLSLFKKIRKELALLYKIRSNNYDMVINLTEGDRGALAARISKAKIRVGCNQAKGWHKRNTYTHVAKNCPHPRHTVERNLDLLRNIGIFPTPEQRDLFLHVPPSSTERMIQLLEASDLSVGKFIVIHPVSRWRFKCLSTRQMAHLMTTLYGRGEQIVLTAGPDPMEIAMIQEIMAQAPLVPALNLAGKLSLKELGALIALSQTLICVDSVPLHIASAVKTPVVALFGPSSDQNWGPWMHPRARVVAQGFSCRPCYQDGCGGGKMSDCLFSMPEKLILDAFDEVQRSKAVTRLATHSVLSRSL